MRILVTGSEGTVGSILVPYLRKTGHLVFCTDQVKGYGEEFLTANILVPGDITTVFSFFKPEAVFHLAAMVSRIGCEASPHLTIDTNISGLNNVIQLCKAFDAKLIYFSTSEVYGDIAGPLFEHMHPRPKNLYAVSKWMGEQLVNYEMTKGLRAVIVRPFMFYHENEKNGQNHSAIIRFCNSLVNKEKITVHIGSSRSWMHLDDGVFILEKILSVNKNDIINIGLKEILLTSDLARIICNKLDLEYSDYVVETPLPERMSLTKIPEITKQTCLIGPYNFIKIEDGIDRILAKLQR